MLDHPSKFVFNCNTKKVEIVGSFEILFLEDLSKLLKTIFTRQVNETQIHLSMILQCVDYFGGIFNRIKIS